MGDVTLTLTDVRVALGSAVLAAGLLAGCPGRSPGPTEDTGDSDTEAASSTGDTDEPGEIPAICARWVGCSAEIDPMASAETEAEFGVGGTCWALDEAGQAGCIARCDNGLREYGDAFPDEQACRYDDLVGTAQFKLGEAVFDPEDPLADPVYRELTQGDTLTIVLGGQGLLMLPLAVRGSGFQIPENPTDWDDPRMPRINLWVDIEGFNVGFGGHFARVPDYTIGFVPIDDKGTLEHIYIAVLVPDGIEDPEQLLGRPGLIRAELRTYKQPTVAQELSFVVAPEIQQ